MSFWKQTRSNYARQGIYCDHRSLLMHFKKESTEANQPFGRINVFRCQPLNSSTEVCDKLPEAAAHVSTCRIDSSYVQTSGQQGPSQLWTLLLLTLRMNGDLASAGLKTFIAPPLARLLKHALCDLT